nr:BrnA antitoxin family protein [Phormidesmis priestleyi]
MNNTSKTNWEKVDSLTEEEIDTSDIPPLTEEFFSKSRWWKPVAPLNVLVQVDPSTLAWFQAQGEDYEKKMAAALRIYAEAHKVESNSEQAPAA